MTTPNLTAAERERITELFSAFGDLAERVMRADGHVLSDFSQKTLQVLRRTAKEAAAAAGTAATTTRTVKPARSRGIGWLHVSTSTYRLLEAQESISSAGDLLDASDDQLLAIPGIGAKRLVEIREALKRLQRRAEREAFHASTDSGKAVTLAEIGIDSPPHVEGPTRAARDALDRWWRYAMEALAAAEGHPFSWVKAVHRENDAAAKTIRDNAERIAHEPGGVLELDVPPRTRHALLRNDFSTIADVEEFLAANRDREGYMQSMKARSWDTVRAAIEARRSTPGLGSK